MVGRQARHQTKSLRDFVWWEDFNLGRDVLCNGRATDKQKKSDRSRPYRRRRFPGGGPGGAGAPPGKRYAFAQHSRALVEQLVVPILIVVVINMTAKKPRKAQKKVKTRNASFWRIKPIVPGFFRIGIRFERIPGRSA